MATWEYVLTGIFNFLLARHVDCTCIRKWVFFEIDCVFKTFIAVSTRNQFVIFITSETKVEWSDSTFSALFSLASVVSTFEPMVGIIFFLFAFFVLMKKLLGEWFAFTVFHDKIGIARLKDKFLLTFDTIYLNKIIRHY